MMTLAVAAFTHTHTHTHTQPTMEGEGLENAQSLSDHYLVEMSAVTTSGHDTVGAEMRAFAEQLKPYPHEITCLLIMNCG